MPITITAKRLRELREKKQVSQDDVSKFLGVERTTYTSYESGRSRPVRVLNKLAEYYNVSIDYLLGLADLPLPKEVNINTLSDTEKQLVFDFRSLNNIGKEKIISYLSDISNIQSYTIENEEKEKVISA